MTSEESADPPPSFEAVQDDPFAILGVEKAATDDEIKSAYRKLALKYHPDKNQGNEEAELMFQRVQTAYGILSNPELRAKYEAGGLEALDEASLQQHGIQVDVSQTGIVGSTLLAMFRKLGHPIKTVVAPAVLDAVKDPDNLQATPLEWGLPARGRVGNGQAVFYTLDISTEHLTQGFILQASCVHARVKLLLWDLTTDGEWSMAAQEDAVKLGDSNVSAMFQTGADLLDGVPKSVQAHVQQAALADKGQGDPLVHIFRVLDGAKMRDRLTLKPGTHLVAVYGDNFFKKSQYTVYASLLPSADATDALTTTERQITEKRAQLLAFEKDFKKARAEWEAAVAKLEGYTKELDDLFLAREHEYSKVLGTTPATGEAADTADTAAATADTGTPGGGLSTTNIVGGMSEAGKYVRNAGSQLSGAFRGLWGRKGGQGAAAAPGGAATASEA